MKFHYKAIKESGEVYESDTTAESEQALYARLKSRGETLVMAEAGDGTSRPWYKMNISFLTSLKTEDKILFARNIAAMIDAGLPIARALDVIKRQTSNDYFKDILTSLQETIRSGKLLSTGLEQYPDEFSSLFTNMVKAGEESGDMAQALSEVADQMERAHTLKKKIRGAMMYPSIIVFAVIVIGILMMIYVVPTLTATFEEMGVDLPFTTQIVIGISNFLANYTVVAVGSMVAVVVAFIYAIRTKPGKRALDWTLLHMPLIKDLVKETNSARTAHTLSSLLTSGVEVTRSLEITGDVLQNTYYRDVIEETRTAVESGQTMSSVFEIHEDIYPPFVSEMVAVGEETGKIAELLNRVGDYYQEDVTQRTKNMSTIIEPFLMLVIGGAVGFFALSMISPMYSLTSTI